MHFFFLKVINGRLLWLPLCKYKHLSRKLKYYVFTSLSLSILPSCFATIDHGVWLTLDLSMHYKRTTQTFNHQPHALQHTVIQLASITIGWQQTQTSSFIAFCMDARHYVKVLPGTEIMVVCGGGKLHCECAVDADRVNGSHNQLPTTCS